MIIEIADITHTKKLRILENLLRVELSESLKAHRPYKSRIERKVYEDGNKSLIITVDCKQSHHALRIFIFYTGGKVHIVCDRPSASTADYLTNTIAEYTQEVTRLNGVPW